MSKELLSLKVPLSLFQSIYFTTIHSTGMILKSLIQIGIIINFMLSDSLAFYLYYSVMFIMYRSVIGLPQRREPSGHNLLTCHLVLVLAAALGWGLLCWRLRCSNRAAQEVHLCQGTWHWGKKVLSFYLSILWYTLFIFLLQVPLQTVIGVTMSPKNGIYLKVANRSLNN